jgi:hypothetical protein
LWPGIYTLETKLPRLLQDRHSNVFPIITGGRPLETLIKKQLIQIEGIHTGTVIEVETYCGASRVRELRNLAMGLFGCPFLLIGAFVISA